MTPCEVSGQSGGAERRDISAGLRPSSKSPASIKQRSRFKSPAQMPGLCFPETVVWELWGWGVLFVPSFHSSLK